ncbi:MAG TPA: hypothetical protein VLC48_07990 [Gemmatimonadota bacterium]|nr:hypothetical protein [Gemmatimonadota bacterium]
MWRRLTDLAPQLGGDWRAVRGGGPGPEPPAEPTAQGEAELVEDGGELRVHDLGAPLESAFEFFLDGIEYARICGYVGMIPVVHGYVAAVIRQRNDRVFRTWKAIEREVLAFPHDLLPPDRFLELGLPQHALIDSAGEPAAVHPIRLAEEGRAAVKLQRARLEQQLARAWTDAGPHDGWLLVDGRLAIEPALLKSGRAIGLVKSHRTQYLGPGDMAAVLRMSGARRSSVFKPVRPEVGEVYSWYLRLRPPGDHDIYWALARIEGRVHSETLELADDVSRWLLAETAPLALPDPRWHVLLYPIRDCEGYLRARMPTLDVG